jgi:two-component system KDP operon response regulator KdpE
MAVTLSRRLTVLLIDGDGVAARDQITKLESRSFDVWHVETADEARAILQGQQPDVILMEILLRDADGLLLCAALREIAEVPIFVCSATSRKRDAALSLKLGADEFMRKPLDIDEFEARLERTLRRGYQFPSPPTAEAVTRVGPLVIDRAIHQVLLAGRPLALTPTEFRLLDALAIQPGALVSHAKLAELLWSEADASGSSLQAINMHMHRLRGKLAQDPSSAPRVIAVRGVGYRLMPPSLDAVAPLVIFPSGKARAS